MNEEKQSIIEEVNGDDQMIIKNASVSKREKIVQMEARLNMSDKIVFYANIALFFILTIYNVTKIYP